MNTKWEEEFDKEFEDFYDIGVPTEEHMDAGSEVIHYEALKAFIKDQITKAQQEIAEQIIEDIPDRYKSMYFTSPDIQGNGGMEHITTDLTNLKDQLRKKYIN